MLDAAAVGGWVPGVAAVASSSPPARLATDGAAPFRSAAPVMGCSPCLGESRGAHNKPCEATDARPSGRLIIELDLPVGQLLVAA